MTNDTGETLRIRFLRALGEERIPYDQAVEVYSRIVGGDGQLVRQLCATLVADLCLDGLVDCEYDEGSPARTVSHLQATPKGRTYADETDRLRRET